MRLTQIVLCCGLAVTASASAQITLDTHAALALGYNWSDGSNYLGSSQGNGSSFTEVAVNAQSVLLPRLLASGQLNARRAGKTDDGSLQVDYAQLDYQVQTASGVDFGLRVGRVKNPYGFSNTVRDVVFSRPGITMPSSIYFDGNGYRDLYFSSDGAQAYGHFTLNGEPGEWTVGWAMPYDGTDEFVQALTGSTNPTEIEVTQFFTAQWLQDWADGQFRTGVSYLRIGVDAEIDIGADSPFISKLDVDSYVLSGQWQLPQWLLTTELRYNDNSYAGTGGKGHGSNDGGYLQLRWMPSGKLSYYGRYDLTYTDRSDRSGREYAAAQEGRERYRRFGHDGALGLAWKPSSQWGLYAEYHYVYGTANVPAAENATIQRDPHWQLLLIMLGYRF